MATLKETTAAQFKATSAASDATHLVRLQEYEAAMAAKSATGHTHAASQVTDLAEVVQDLIGAAVVGSASVASSYSDPAGTVTVSVRLKSGGGLLVDAEGLSVMTYSGPGGAAPYDHTHADLHAALTVVDSESLALTLAGQELTGAVRLKTAGGLGSGADGLYVLFGTGAYQVAEGNHTHTDLHAALTKSDSDTLALTLAGQLLSGSVRLKASGGLLADAEGLSVMTYSGPGAAAPFSHTHDLATAVAHGFMSAADKAKLDRYDELVQADYPVLYHRADALLANDMLGGVYRWGQDMEVVDVTVICDAPQIETVLQLQLDGVDSGLEVTIPVGTANAERQVLQAVSPAVVIAAGEKARWQCISGAADATADQAASKVSLAMQVRPALGTIPELRINCGGGAIGGTWSADTGYDGGTYHSTATSINLSGVSDPAPMAVYQSQRNLWYSTAPLIYTITGLARGIDYLVRLHFAEWYFTNVGDQSFNIQVVGSTTESASAYDVLAAAGGRWVGVVREFTLKADSSGQIKVKLYPLPGSGGHSFCGVNGIEVVAA